MGRPGIDPWIEKIPWRRAWQPTPIVWPGESQGQRSLAGSSAWDQKESDTTERLTPPLNWRTWCLSLEVVKLSCEPRRSTWWEFNKKGDFWSHISVFSSCELCMWYVIIYCLSSCVKRIDLDSSACLGIANSVLSTREYKCWVVQEVNWWYLEEIAYSIMSSWVGLVQNWVDSILF